MIESASANKAKGKPKVRLFIALEVPIEIKPKLEAVQLELQRGLEGAEIHWTRAEQFHLTLRFLGDVDADRVEALGKAVRASTAGGGELNLIATQMGCFPNLRRPRVIWIGVKEQGSRLAQLQQKIQEASREFSLKPAEKHFSAHITLARIKNIGRKQIDELARIISKFAEHSWGEWAAGELKIMRSELLPQGTRHSVLDIIRFGQAA